MLGELKRGGDSCGRGDQTGSANRGRVPQGTIRFVVRRFVATATRGPVRKFVRAGISDVDVAAKRRRLKDERGEKKDQKKVHAAIAPHARSQRSKPQPRHRSKVHPLGHCRNRVPNALESFGWRCWRCGRLGR